MAFQDAALIAEIRAYVRADVEITPGVAGIFTTYLGVVDPYVVVPSEELDIDYDSPDYPVPGWVQDTAMPEIMVQSGGDYFNGYFGTVKGVPAIWGGWGCPLSSAIMGIFVHPDNVGVLPNFTPEA